MSGMRDAIAWFEASETMLRVTHGDEVADEAMDIAARMRLAARLRGDREQVQAVVVETVGFIAKGVDGDLVIDWSIEGGIDAMEVGCELIVSTSPITNAEGMGEVYTRPQPVAGDAVRALQRWDIGYTQFGACIQLKPNGTFVKLADVVAALSTQPAPSAQPVAWLDGDFAESMERNGSTPAWVERRKARGDAVPVYASTPSEQVAASVAVPDRQACFDLWMKTDQDHSTLSEHLHRYTKALLAAAPVAPEREG